MSVSVSSLADFNIAECSGELTVVQISEAYSIFQQLVGRSPSNLMVDLSQLNDFDSAALQLMLWLKAAVDDACQLQFIVADNDVVTKVLDLYQLSEQFTALETCADIETCADANTCAEVGL